MAFSDKLNENVLPAVMKFVNLKGVVALKDGLLYTLPLTLIGSVFLLLSSLPSETLNVWLANTLGEGWTDPLLQAYGSSFNIIALIAVVGIAYTYAKNEGYEPLSAGVIGFVSFLITIEGFVVTEDGTKVGDVIPKTWLGGKGMVTAIIIGLIVGAVYSWFMKKDIRIKMPAGVPEGVANSFSSLIPAAVIIIGSTIVYAVFNWGFHTTFVDVIYKVIQTPVQGLTDSLGGVLAMGFLIPFLWWFGVHGSTIVGGIMGSILTANTLENQAIIDSGRELTIANGAHIVTQQFLDQYMTVTGAGMTIGLVVCMLFLAKSAQCKQLGRLASLPAAFNINEPLTFGTPIVMNPFMAIPFILTPMLSGLITYFAIATGLVPPFGGVMVPWTCPPIISGFLVNGVRGALLQIVVLSISFFTYLPFFKKVDKMNYENELAAQNNVQA